VPVNVTLLFSREHYLSVAEAYMRGIKRRVAAGLDPRVNFVASLFVSRGTSGGRQSTPELRNRLGMRSRHALTGRMATAHDPRWRDLEAAGARKQRMLWAATGTRTPSDRPVCTSRRWRPRHHRHDAGKTLLAFAAGGTVKS